MVNKMSLEWRVMDLKTVEGGFIASIVRVHNGPQNQVSQLEFLVEDLPPFYTSSWLVEVRDSKLIWISCIFPGHEGDYEAASMNFSKLWSFS